MKNNIKEKDMSVHELADLMLKSFDTAQKHINERFERVDKKFETLTTEMSQNFTEVKKQIEKININAVDVVRQEEFNELENRMVDVEEILKLKIKGA